MKYNHKNKPKPTLLMILWYIPPLYPNGSKSIANKDAAHKIKLNAESLIRRRMRIKFNMVDAKKI